MTVQELRPIAEWAADVPCQRAPELFFPRPGAKEPEIGRARDICRSCPAQVECLRWALDHCENAGIWGGLTPNERAELRRRR